jgi:LacI family transcriptional regulator
MERKIPYVLIDRKPLGMNAHFVGVNDEMVGYLATKHLIANGYRRIAHIRGSELSPGILRFAGYRRALQEAGRPVVPELIVEAIGGESDWETGGFKAMQELLALSERPDAVFGFNDPSAIGALKALYAEGVSVPGEIAMIGAGNFRHADLFRVPLSTMDQRSVAIGERAAELLLELLETKSQLEPRNVLLEPLLLARESTKLKD